MIQIAGGIILALLGLWLLKWLIVSVGFLYQLDKPDMTPEQIAKIEASKAEYERLLVSSQVFQPTGHRDI